MYHVPPIPVTCRIGMYRLYRAIRRTLDIVICATHDIELPIPNQSDRLAKTV